MSRVLLALLALLALTTAIAWYALAAGPTRTASAPVPTVAPEPQSAPPTVELAEAPRVEPESAARPVERTALDTRAAVRSASDEELVRAHWVEGRVLFPPGTPGDEALFVVADGRDFEDGSDQRARVEADGRFRVAFSERTRKGRLRLEGRYLYLAQERVWERGEPGEVVLEPELGGRAEVHLLAPPAVELAGRVSLTLQNRGEGFNFAEDAASREVDSSGTVAFDALAPGRDHTLRFEGPRLVADDASLVVEPGRTLVLQLALRPGLVLFGLVRDETGEPVAQAQVFAALSGASGSSFARFTRSDEAGRYRLEAMAIGAGTVHVQHAGFEPLELEFAPTADELQLDLVLRRGRAISGTVRWPDGSPAEAFLALVPLPGTEAMGQHSTVTGRAEADGSFAISGLVASAYHVRAWAKRVTEVEGVSEVTGLARARKERETWNVEVDEVAVGSSGLALVLDPGLTVRGVVRGGAGETLDDVRVSSRRTTFPSRAWEHQAGPTERFRDTAGAFELVGFRPGTWELRASARGRADSAPVYVEVPTDAPVELVLERAATVRGIVLGEDGRPAARASVTAVQPEQAGEPHLRRAENSSRTTSAKDGSFEIDGLNPGRTLLSVESDSDTPGERVELELVGGETREGVVLHLKAACVLEVEVVDRNGLPEPNLDVLVTTQERDHFDQFTTDTSGRFTCRGMPEGVASVQTTNGEGMTLHATAELRAGGVARVRLAPPEGRAVRVHGRVLVGGDPLVGATVNAHREDLRGDPSGAYIQTRAPTDASGSYELLLPDHGRWLLNVYGASDVPGQWSVPVDVPAADVFAHDLTLEVARVSGRVRSSDGAPLAQMWVRSEPQQHDGGTRGSASTRTDSEGRYELVLPVGQHAIVAGGDRGPWSEGPRGWCQQRVDGLRLVAGERRDSVDFALQRGGTLRGVVRRSGGYVAANARVLVSDGAAFEPAGSSDASGSFRIEGLRPGTLWVRAVTSGSATSSASSVAIRAGEEAQIELVLVPGVSVHVRVLDAGGAPLGSEIEAVDGDGLAVPQNAWGAQGEVRLGPLTPGTYRITARREEKLAQRTLEIAGGESELEVVLGFD